ncbi:amidohydrolase family protein [Antarcticibacterium flavum]|uniref:Amidohydrolase family protein n=1 Tax=Antarcticibacterium flavum TaxID=2058175 RepID=A0A5B7X1A6_9FLAO|nr:MULTISPECIES: amidohydrolase family protein [Antarcticibacterium]MCM4158601.1 amidohydrolase [Antarcticibacterium sp. W02-3]QCY68462.1 amidohydrolase family protein [Antarcticibacterium flavum]
MNSFRKILGILAFILLFINQLQAQEKDDITAEVFVFKNVNVLPMDREEVLEDHHVIVENNRITRLGPSAEITIPQGAVEIEGRGRYLMPGLAEMHGHIPGEDQVQYAEDVLFLYIANGVTTVRNMLGTKFQLQLRERVRKGELPGPTIFAASPWLSQEAIPTPQAADNAVREYKSTGFDLLKIGSLEPETYKQMAATAHEIGMPFGGHIPEAVGLAGALEARQTSIDHYDRYVEFLVPEEAKQGRSNGFFGSGIIGLIDRERIPLAIEKTLEAGTWNVPTLSLIEHLANEEEAEEMIKRPEMKYMPKQVLDGWVKFKNDYVQRDDFQPDDTAKLVEFRRELTKKLHDAGANIVLGSDAPQFFNVPGFSIHHELEMMVNSGLSPYEVLVTGTKNAAEYFATPEEFGTIQPGRRADLILLNSNPIEDISNVKDRAGVMVRGEWYPEEKISEKLQEIEKRNRGN